jgi:hypothetical protein
MRKTPKTPHIGSSLDDFLKKEGVFEEIQVRAITEVIAWQLEEAMKKNHVSKAGLANSCARAARRSTVCSIQKATLHFQACSWNQPVNAIKLTMQSRPHAIKTLAITRTLIIDDTRDLPRNDRHRPATNYALASEFTSDRGG